jgi:hypothetical protein
MQQLIDIYEQFLNSGEAWTSTVNYWNEGEIPILQQADLIEIESPFRQLTQSMTRISVLGQQSGV